MKTAVIYARVSSSNDRQDTSRQIEDLKKYAISQDIEIVNYNRQIKKFPTEKQNVSLKHILT